MSIKRFIITGLSFILVAGCGSSDSTGVHGCLGGGSTCVPQTTYTQDPSSMIPTTTQSSVVPINQTNQAPANITGADGLSCVAVANPSTASVGQQVNVTVELTSQTSSIVYVVNKSVCTQDPYTGGWKCPMILPGYNAVLISGSYSQKGYFAAPFTIQDSSGSLATCYALITIQ